MSAKDTANKIKAMANSLRWTCAVQGTILTIQKRFTPGNKDEFVQADGEYYNILGLLPQTTPGSTWGTDGGGIGALTAIKSGVFTMNKSGGSVRVLNALRKLEVV